MAVSLTTLTRVRQRLQLETWESTDIAITQFITDAEALITNAIGSLPVSGDANFAAAGSVATDMAAYRTGISLPALDDAEAEKERLNRTETLKTTADADLAALIPAATVPMPRSTTSS